MLLVELKNKSPSFKEVVGSEVPIRYVSPNALTEARLLATVLTLAIAPPTLFTLVIAPATVLILELLEFAV